jgi:hypothetical protein
MKQPHARPGFGERELVEMVTVSVETVLAVALAIAVAILAMQLQYQLELERSRRLAILAATEPAIGMGCVVFFILVVVCVILAMVITEG